MKRESKYCEHCAKLFYRQDERPVTWSQKLFCSSLCRNRHFRGLTKGKGIKRSEQIINQFLYGRVCQ